VIVPIKQDFNDICPSSIENILNDLLLGKMSMTISMYQASVPSLIRSLKNLAAILEKSAGHAEARKIEPSVLLNSRLYPDMFPLSRQVQIASDMARRGAARLAGLEAPPIEDNETTFTELIARLHKTTAYLETLTPAQIDGSEEKLISLRVGDNTLNFEGLPYLLYFVLPNVYFHVTTAYDILRHCGVELSKLDFLGKP
jgi:hypothetical protein